MNNEPVAWMIIDVDNGKSLQFKENKFSEINIPLYTTPREVSDEEIMEIFTAYEQMQEYGYVGKKPFKVSLGWSLSERNDCLMLARAILKKASEK